MYIYMYIYIYVYIYIHTYSKYSRQPVVSAVAVRAFCLFGSDLLSPQAQGLLNQNAMLTWPNVQYHNCCTRKGALSLTRPLSLLNPLFIRLIQKICYSHVELKRINLLQGMLHQCCKSPLYKLMACSFFCICRQPQMLVIANQLLN